MWNWIIMFFFSISSTLLLLVIYLIKSSYWIIHINNQWNVWINILMYIFVSIILSYLFILYFKKISAKDSIESEVTSIASVNNEYIPVYLGYIFVSVSIPNPCPGQVDWITFSVVYLLINIIITCAKTLCFNPLFILFGYGYYAITTSSNIKLYIITRRSIGKRSCRVTFPKLRKITEVVYFEE